MKKIISLSVGLIALLMLFGCAMAPQFEEISFQGSLYYSGNTMTFTNTDPKDILYNTGNPADDFIILYRLLETNPSESDLINYRNFMTKLYELSILKQLTMRELFSKTSADLKNLFESEGLVLTLNEIVLFNQVKSKIESFESTGTAPRIGKTTYINQRLGIDLTREEIDALDLLQGIYLDFTRNHDPLLFQNYDTDAFITKLNAEMTLNETFIPKLRIAFEIVKSLLSS